MSLYVHIAEQCQQEALSHGVDQLLNNLKINIEKNQNLIGFGFFSPSKYIKKNLARGFRLIAYQTTVQEDELVLFLRVLPRGSKDYERFSDYIKDNPEKVEALFTIPSKQELEKIIDEFKKMPPQPLPPTPNVEESQWLYSVFTGGIQWRPDDLLILETDNWVQKMRSRDFQDYRILYHQVLEKIITQNLASTNPCIAVQELWSENENLGIMYFYRPEAHQLILLEPVTDRDDFSSLKSNYAQLITEANHDPERLIRIAARSYPSLIVLDQEAWLKIQKDEEANLALSPEEARLLESIRFPHRSAGDRVYRYPLFINGRAGSGKSTMLQYLMADYLDFALRQQTTLMPLYMTCSAELLQEAKRTVHALLTCHHERLLTSQPSYPALATIDDKLKRSFVVFRDFLYDLLPEDQRDRFSPEKHISFYSFCRLWEKQFSMNPIARQVGVDVAWHTIRSFIKGMRSDLEDDFGPDDFAALPRKRRSISRETYQLVFSQVWEGWYKKLCTEKGYWDDQDLAVAVLSSASLDSLNFSAIFCDEAQDFTSVEIELILRLSVFAKRLLVPEQISAVPFVFAGDPLQTLNPTGFRWEAVKADFYERFCAVLDPRRRAALQINYQELNYNYRSNPGIVNFCNLIQLVRATLFQDSNIHPQEPWWIEPAVPVNWVNADTPLAGELMRQHPETIKLINCNEGQESDFARNDSLLSEITQTEGVYRNILSPMRAKGLEFPIVVLYRFGQDATVHGFQQLLQGATNVAEDPEAKLPIEYFLNRLYVAASRAKKQLLIVDTQEALSKFWQFATNEEVVRALLTRVPSIDAWDGKITTVPAGIYKGTQAAPPEGLDLSEQGQEFAKQGRLKRDPYLMRQAAMAYDNAGQTLEGKKCRAAASEFEDRFGEAGQRYEELGLCKDAFRCYWQGKLFKKISELTSRESSLTGSLESRAADFMVEKRAIPGVFLSDILDAIARPIWLEETYKDPTWRFIFLELVKRLSELTSSQQVEWQALDAMTERLTAKRIPLPAAHRALIAYRAGNYQNARVLFENAEMTDSREYALTRAYLETFPRNVIWFHKLKDHAKIMEEWLAKKSTPSFEAELLKNRDAFLAVVDASLETNNLPLAMELLQKQPNNRGIEKLLKKSIEQSDAATACEAAILVIRSLVENKKWREVIRAVKEAKLPSLSNDQNRTLHTLLQQNGGTQRVFAAAVSALASSEELAVEKSSLQAPVSEFLHRHFISTKGWRTMRPSLSIALVGAAIERAGRIVYALQYYEGLLKDPNLPPAERTFVAERLVASSERYIHYLQKANELSKAKDVEEEGKKLRAQYNIRGSLPAFPYLTKEILELGRPTDFQQGPYKITISRPHRKVRIEHTERFAIVTLSYENLNLQGEGNFQQVESLVWRSQDWNLTIQLTKKEGSLHLQGKYDNGFFEIPL